MTISPSSAEWGGRRSPSFRSSGKYRSSGRSFRDQSASSPPSFSSTPRKPSHFGSYRHPSPSGSSETSSASIGGKGTFGPGASAISTRNLDESFVPRDTRWRGRRGGRAGARRQGAGRPVPHRGARER